MLESFAAWILNTYIGDHFGNVNTHQLRMSLQKGEIELEHLPLKRDLIKYLGLPLEAKTGFIGKISIKFPSWHSFTSEPLVITIEDLFLIIKPITNFDYNEEEENRAQQEFKLSQLDTMEQRWKALHDEDLTEPSSYYSSSYSSWLNYGSSFINNVLMNIHLKISSIHIRYEDYSTIPGCPFATGVVIRSLTICSTDENWQPKFVTRTATGHNQQSSDNFLFKLIELESFSCYMDTETMMFGSNKIPFDQMIDLMRQTLDRNLNRKEMPVEHGYLVAPVNGKCYLKRNCSEMSLKSCWQPRTVIDVQLERVPIMMTAIQYKHLLDWSLAFQTQKTLWRYRKWRPMIHPKGERRSSKRQPQQQPANLQEGETTDLEHNQQESDVNENSVRYEFDPKIWWHFAVNANLEEYRHRRQRFNWHFILSRARDVVAYHRAYLHYLIYPECFTKEMRYVKDRVENEFTLDELCSIREIVFWKADRILKKQMNHTESFSNNVLPANTEQKPKQSSGYWFLPYNVLSNLYENFQYKADDSDESPVHQQSTPIASVDSNNPTTETIEKDFDSNKKSKHRRNGSSQSLTNSMATPEDIFLTRDAIYCQFNFQIHNSSFQLIAFSSDEQENNQQLNDQTFVSASSATFLPNKQEQQGNLLLEFEFNQMKIGIDVTNPHAYSCSCHHRSVGGMEMANVPDGQQQTNKTMFLTQNELNQLQLDLNFECQNLNLTLLRTDDAIISDTEMMQKLATAQLTGCGLQFCFSNDLISIDSKLESLELLDLITAPKVNKHKRVLSIGTRSNSSSEQDSVQSARGPVEKAFMFSLCRQMNENVLRVNVEMASFCYVHSGLLVYELSSCQKCFSDVLEAHFSRAFKERVKAATTEVFRGIVSAANDSSNETDLPSSEIVHGNSSPKLLLPDSSLNGKDRMSKISKLKVASKKKTKAHSAAFNPFVENLKLNIFIRSPVLIFPISPCSHEVVVFHLGHMLLNNHNHSSDICSVGPPTQIRVPQRKLAIRSFNQSGQATHQNNSYNAEIRDLSVYSLNCLKNFSQSIKSDGDEPEFRLSVQELYNCDLFAVPILQKTIIEIVLERKVLLSSTFDPVLSSKMKRSPEPNALVASSSYIVDGLNLISSVNSIDPLVLPKKFSIRQHLCQTETLTANAHLASGHQLLRRDKLRKTKPEMVLSVEISSIDVRFSYTDLLIFWHILNTLTDAEPAPYVALEAQNLDANHPNETLTTLNESEEMTEMLQQIALSNMGFDAEEFRCRLNNLLDLGFDLSDSIQALILKNGDIIEAAYLLSSGDANNGSIGQKPRKSPDLAMSSDTWSELGLNNQSSDDNHSQCTSVSTVDGLATTTASGESSNVMDNGHQQIYKNQSSGGKRKDSRKKDRQSNLLLSMLSVVEIKILNGSIRIIDDCNQLDLPLLELGVTDFRLMQYYKSSPAIEAHAQTNFYCDYYNSHLSGWEPFVENCQLAFSWKHHEPRCHLKSMLNPATMTSNNRISVARQKLALKIDVKRMLNLNVSRTMLDLVEKVHNSWWQDIENFMSLPMDQRAFRQRHPFIPFALKNETGTQLQMFVCNSNKMFATGKAPDLQTPCDLKSVLDVETDNVVYFDCVDLFQPPDQDLTMLEHRNYARAVGAPRGRISASSSSAKSPLKIYVKIEGWKATFPLSIEREGTFIRHIVSQRYNNQSAILVFEICLQSSAIKLITVRSSLVVTNRTTKTVELKFINTAISDVRTSYMIRPDGVFPVPLDLLYARIQLRPCDLGIGACSTYIHWNHVRKFEELDCSLQICTPITHTQHGSYSKSQPYVVSVLVQRNSIGALIESRDIFRLKTSPLQTLPSHTITLLPPLKLANRLPFELRFKIIQNHHTNNSLISSNSNSVATAGTIKPGDDHSVHYISPLESFSIEFQMEQFPHCRALNVEPGAIKNYQTHIDMYDARNRTLVLNAHVAVQSGSPKPSNAMSITIYAPYWIVNRSGLPLVFAQADNSNVIEEAAGQCEEHERARSISPLLFSFADQDRLQYCIMRLGRMLPNMAPRWCNLFCLEKGTFYRRLRVTEYNDDVGQSVAKEKIYEFGIDIRQGRDRYSQTKIVTIAPRFQIENLTSFKLEFAQKCLIEPVRSKGGASSSAFTATDGFNHYQSIPNDSNSLFNPSHMSSPVKNRIKNDEAASNTDDRRPTSKSPIISALPKSNMPFHWPAADKPKMLCVKIGSLIDCLWSGCFDVGSEPSVSFHLNIRDDMGHSNFIRVEILLQNATYFIVFTDANSLPPPIRVENFSQVAIEFYQAGSPHRTMVRPNCSVPYALDEPSKPAHLTVCAPGGSTSTYDLNSFAPGNTLTYDNFYYLAFEETFSHCNQFASNGTNNNHFLDYDDDFHQLLYMMVSAPDLSFMENETKCKMLVLDVPDYYLNENSTTTMAIRSCEPTPKPIVLGRKERGKRSQLWRQDSNNHLIHEGTSPPLEPPGFQDIGFAEVKFSHSPSTLMVLDVMDDELMLSPNQTVTSIPLAVRQMNPSRSSTQTWQFTEDGRLRCLKYWNMFVQPLAIDPKSNSVDGVFQVGAMAVIAFGPPESSVTKATIPKEQAVIKQKMRKGSGVLNVSILADGPSRVLRIKDNQLTANSRHLNLVQYTPNHNLITGQFGQDALLARNGCHQQTESSQSFLMRFLNKTELELNLQMDSVGISIISRSNEEIVFLFMRKIILELLCNPLECRLNCVVEDFQVDNQLLHCEKEVVLYVTNLECSESPSHVQTQQSSSNYHGRISANERPAITFNLHKLFIPDVEINVFKSLQISINDLVMNIEELVLLKLLEYINYDPVDSEMDEISSSTVAGSNSALLYHTSGNVISSSLSRSVQYFFAYLLIQLQRIKLSVFTSTKSVVSGYLHELKKKAGIKLIRFEEALIQLKPFHKVYSLMTRKFLQDSIHEHYRSELRSQAAKILGTVDFLGNPVGFINNVIEGINELYNDGSFRGLIMNVTHGISDSTAKVTSVLSESLGFVTMDDRHQEIRRKIKQQTGGIGGQRSHLVVGAFGLAHGILGGITSVITQTYDGIVNHGGVTGFLSGLSKGVLGTFTKPAVGMLDFASEAATAVRDSSRKACFGINGRQVRRVRLPRTLTIDGRLTRYQWQQSQWQSRFYNTADFGSQREYGEQFVHVFAMSDRHFVLLTTERLYFFHAPIKKCHLPPEDDDFVCGEESALHRRQQDLILTNCPIQQLQILPLEHFEECNYHQMSLQDGQYFLKTHATCTDLSLMIANTVNQTQSNIEDGSAEQAIFHFVEFRQTTTAHRNTANVSYHGDGSAASGHNTQQSRRKQSFEYPRHLSPCYVYCDCGQLIQRIIQLINEAKHLQEERKFEVSNLDY